MIKKKKVVPDKVVIGPFTYDVMYPAEKLDGNEVVGLFEHGAGRIRLSDRDGGVKRNPQKIVETLIHEIFHGIDISFCGDVMSEEMISMLSTIWYGILVDNDLGLQTNKLPDVVKVGGVFYDVIFPFDFDDGDNCIAARACHASTTILIADNYNTVKNSLEFLQSNLILSTMSAVIGVFEISLSDVPDNALSTFCTGLYHVLRDNDLEKYIKNVRS